MSKLLTNTTDLQDVLEALQNKAYGGEQATPEISVDDHGLITATAGNKSSTYQLAFQSAKTITPTTKNQVAISSGYYTVGDITVEAVPTQTKNITPTSSSQDITPDNGKFLSKVTVEGDANLIASNIRSGVTIFGVTGTWNGASGDSIITFEIQLYNKETREYYYKEYQSEDNMTWEEWIVSDYNVDGYIITQSIVGAYHNSGNLIYTKDDPLDALAAPLSLESDISIKILPSDKIISGETYCFSMRDF